MRLRRWRGVDAGEPLANRGRVLLQRKDQSEAGNQIVEELSQRFAVSSLGEKSSTLSVELSEQDPARAELQLAVALDEIDRDWEAHFRWPQGIQLEVGRTSAGA